MPELRATHERLAAALPDIPRWLETRSLLLSGEAEVLGLDEGELSFVVRDPVEQLISIVGRPDLGAVRDALDGSDEGAVMICQSGDEQRIAPVVPEWLVIPATLHLLAREAAVRELDTTGVRFLKAHEIAAAQMPEPLRDELRRALLHSEVAATIVAGRPVAFCYAGSVTESLWDISIDTLVEYRRRGYAGLAVARLIERMEERRKRAVWGAEETNVASMSLARKLGVEPVDRLIVLRPAPPR
jgi:GNAT superfamily N-acetyltransferase